MFFYNLASHIVIALFLNTWAMVTPKVNPDRGRVIIGDLNRGRVIIKEANQRYPQSKSGLLLNLI